MNHVATVTIPKISPDEFRLIKEIVAPPGTPEIQIQLAIAYAQQLGLDPLRKQVMVIKTRGGYQVVVGIHGVGALVARHSEYRGCQSAAVFTGEEISIEANGRVTHTYNPAKRGTTMPIGAWATTSRQLGMKTIHFTIYLRYLDYANHSSDSWQKQPAWMIEKTARMFSMRAAFPDQFSNIYAPEEFGERSVEDPDEPVRLSPRVQLGEIGDPEPIKPWERPITEVTTKGELGECSCGAELVRFQSPTTKKWYRQCSEALKLWEETKDKSVFDNHFQELIGGEDAEYE